MMNERRVHVAKMRQLWPLQLDTFSTPHRNTFASQKECVAYNEMNSEDSGHSLSSRGNATSIDSILVI